jgi:hypothetical protein
LKDYSLTIQYKSRYFNVLLEFGLEDFDFKFRNNMFVASLGWGYFFIAILFFANNKTMC